MDLKEWVSLFIVDFDWADVAQRENKNRIIPNPCPEDR